MAESLDQLLERVRAGDESGVIALVERFSPSALRLAGVLLGDAHQAEEAVQDAWLTALADLGDLRCLRAFGAWFRQIVRTQANRRLRRRVEQAQDQNTEVVAPGPTPPDQLERSELAALVRSALARLPEASRETAQRFYLDGWSVAELATAMELPVGTVKRRLHDARARLRFWLHGL